MRAVAAISGMVVSAVLAGACSSAGSSVPQSPATSGDVQPTSVPSPAAAPGPVTVSVTRDGYRLVLTMPTTTVPGSEPVTGEAVLTTVDGREADIAGSGGGVIGFAYREIGGTRSMDGPMTADCAPHRIPAGAGLHRALYPSAAWTEDDPNAAFYRAFTQNPEIRLPAGAWQITAVAVFMGAGCTKPQHVLEVSTVVVVTP